MVGRAEGPFRGPLVLGSLAGRVGGTCMEDQGGGGMVQFQVQPWAPGWDCELQGRSEQSQGKTQSDRLERGSWNHVV